MDYWLCTCTVLLLCVAVAARALFEGVRPSDLTEHAHISRNLIMGGEGLRWERVPSMSAFEALAKQKKMLLAKVA